MAVAHDLVSVLIVAAASEAAPEWVQLLAAPAAGNFPITTAGSAADALARCRTDPPTVW